MTDLFNPTQEPVSTLILSGLAKGQLPWPDVIIKSFPAGAFLSLGAMFDLVIAGGASWARHTALELYVPNGVCHSHYRQYGAFHSQPVCGCLHNMPAKDANPRSHQELGHVVHHQSGWDIVCRGISSAAGRTFCPPTPKKPMLSPKPRRA